MVYLLHFSRAFKHARHFVGATSHAAEARAVAAGDTLPGFDAPLVAAARATGIQFFVVRTWSGGPATARALRDAGNHRRLCRLCTSERAERRT